MNRLYFGDNLKWLSDRKEFPDASVDLVYLDPPASTPRLLWRFLSCSARHLSIKFLVWLEAVTGVHSAE